MAQVTIRVRDDGPLVVEGPVTLIDRDGKPLPVDTRKPGIALCRCGGSANKPFCDGAHRACGFSSQVRSSSP